LRWRRPLRNNSAAREAAALRSLIERSLWVKQRAPNRPRRIGNRYAAPPIRENSSEEKTAPAEPIKLCVGGVTVALGVARTFGSPGTNDNRLKSVRRLSAINITPITSRLR
jgi:hypothetical protein